jgi:hypothetical protein
MPDSIIRLLLEHVSAEDLWHLAAAKRRAEYQPRLPVHAVEELVAMLDAGHPPALGWWRRWRQVPTTIRPVGPIRAEELS